ncbi:MAG: response regulator, partial [Chthonomonadales bacterium]
MEATALKALICEDEGLTVMQWRRALQKAGFEVIGEAKEGARCVDLARETLPDVVLMDLNMP